jgi:hypothetical protein
MSQPDAHHVYKFFVDAKPFETPKEYLSGQEIKRQAGVLDTYQLFLEKEGDIPDEGISDDKTVDMKGKDKHFFAVPPATFGK